eukprot:COSAG06_NODE_59270_length_274_cov_1.731429_1_plen_79_part_10
MPCRDPIGLSGYRHALHLGLVRKQISFPLFNTNTIFTKTGPGQISGKLTKDHRLFMQPFELEPAVDTLEDVAALLRKRG